MSIYSIIPTLYRWGSQTITIEDWHHLETNLFTTTSILASYECQICGVTVKPCTTWILLHTAFQNFLFLFKLMLHMSPLAPESLWSDSSLSSSNMVFQTIAFLHNKPYQTVMTQGVKTSSSHATSSVTKWLNIQRDA